MNDMWSLVLNMTVGCLGDCFVSRFSGDKCAFCGLFGEGKHNNPLALQSEAISETGNLIEDFFC